MNEKPNPLSVRAYHTSQKSLMGFISMLEALHAGVWLGLLDRDTLHVIDEHYYSENSKYYDDHYNRRGLSAWEREAIEGYFQGRRRLLLIGAGGGREVLALSQMGYEVDAAECHPGLVDYANQLLAAANLSSRVYLVPRDAIPQGDALYDGIIVGWGAYMLIQGRSHRVAFLRELRARVKPGTPVLVSFFAREGTERRYRIIVGIGNELRRLRRRELLQLGDALEPTYAHTFSEPEITAELREGGFELRLYSTKGYAHAVATAVE